jgi:putative FmdB family regulatory protein
VPTYEYRCSDCGHQFEVSQRMSDEPLTECEVCGGHVSKMLFAPAIHFKGTGFHNTDYASKRRSASGDDGGGGSDSGDGSSNGKTGSGGDSAASSTPAKTETASSSSKRTVGLDKI